MTRRCGSATLNAAPARRHSRRAVVGRSRTTTEQQLRGLARRLRRTNNNLADLIFTHLPGRVAELLLQPAQRFGTQDDGARRVTHELAVAGFDLGNQLSKTDTRTHLAAVRGVADAAPALLKPSSHRWWLGLNIVGALALNHLSLTNW